MFNYLVLDSFKDKFVGVIGHDYTTGRIFYKVRNKFTDNLLQELFGAEHYLSEDEDGLEFLRELKKTDQDYLENVVSKFDQRFPFA